MPSTEYFGEEEERPSPSAYETAAGELLTELCDIDPTLVDTLGGEIQQKASAVFLYPLSARDDFPQRIDINPYSVFPRYTGASIFLGAKDTPKTLNFGDVHTYEESSIEIASPLLQDAIERLPDTSRNVLERYTMDQQRSPETSEVVPPWNSSIERIQASLLINMCRLDEELRAIIVEQQNRNGMQLSKLIDTAAMPVCGPIDILTEKYPVNCDLETTVNPKGVSSSPEPRSFGEIRRYSQDQIFIEDKLTLYSLASLTDAQQRLLHAHLLDEMVRFHGSKVETLGTSEERENTREIFGAALLKLVVEQPRKIRQSMRNMAPVDPHFRWN